MNAAFGLGSVGSPRNAVRHLFIEHSARHISDHLPVIADGSLA